MPHSWVQSVYHRMGYGQQIDTTVCPPVPKGLYSECERDIRVKYSTPLQLVINADQTPSSYVSVGRKTMAQRRNTNYLSKG